MNTQLCRNGADRPVLSMVQAQNLGLENRGIIAGGPSYGPPRRRPRRAKRGSRRRQKLQRTVGVPIGMVVVRRTTAGSVDDISPEGISTWSARWVLRVAMALIVPDASTGAEA